jgi:hypothetical protein
MPSPASGDASGSFDSYRRDMLATADRGVRSAHHVANRRIGAAVAPPAP